jgi:hypothetical protein
MTKIMSIFPKLDKSTILKLFPAGLHHFVFRYDVPARIWVKIVIRL